MTDPNFIIIYVDSPKQSSVFYQELLGKQPVEESPTFALFALASGVKLGLWSRHTVEPAARTTAGCGELAFAVTSNDEVDILYKRWVDRGLAILQMPNDMDFGYTFVALDPDCHRLRVFSPA